jgi:hypothetical protein
MIISVHRGVFGLDSVVDVSEETLHFHCWSSVYIKLDSPSVWDCRNINLLLKSDKYLCVPVPWMYLLMCYNLLVSINKD